MLEPLLTNAETSRQFVERGGTDVLLKVYQLPKLTVSSTGFAAGFVRICARLNLTRQSGGQPYGGKLQAGAVAA